MGWGRLKVSIFFLMVSESLTHSLTKVLTPTPFRGGYLSGSSRDYETEAATSANGRYTASSPRCSTRKQAA